MRRILTPLAGFVAWFFVATILDRTLRLLWPLYAEALPTFAFTSGMLAARLVEGALSTLATGAVAAWVGRRDRVAIAATGALLLVFFLPTHTMLWSRFPVWYHLLFLGSLAPLTWVGARLIGTRPS